MTASVINITIGSQLLEPGGVTPMAGNRYGLASSGGTPQVSVSTTTVAANIATLVADGASPTQGHVNTLNTNWATLLAKIAANNAAITGDCQVQINSNITTASALKAALNEALRMAIAGGIVTA